MEQKVTVKNISSFLKQLTKIGFNLRGFLAAS